MPRRPVKFIDPLKLKKIEYVDYKDSRLLSEFITYYRSIQSRFYTGSTLKNQKQLARAIKKARIMGLMPFVRYENLENK